MTLGSLYLSPPQKKREEFRNPDLVEVWKTPLAYPQASASLAQPNAGVAFPTTSKTIAAQARQGGSRQVWAMGERGLRWGLRATG